ncbi:MAG TPA: PfkB family carbohydrate kinase [Solirubrobacteraceae bacterium]|nr:PfkB family carbohydrate kinase [Solirubrobacteraceae bacterium]
MITVAGEALMDVLVDSSGALTALPGGAPFNVARTIARLGGNCQFLGKLSDDAFGDQLRASLDRAGVTLAVPDTTSAPTTLALAKLDETGSADYRFYLDGTAAASLSLGDVPVGVLESSDTLALGGLGIVIEPMASSLLELVAQARPQLTVVLDPNCRPAAIGDLTAYRESVRAFLRRVDIIKVSVDDLKLLCPGVGPWDGARSLLAAGPSAVLVTDGPAPVCVLTAQAERPVPVPEVDVVDTIGAGDAFVAAFVAWWPGHSLNRKDVTDIDALEEATAAAVQVAAAACTVRGADLPESLEWIAGGTAAAMGHSRG